MVRTLRPTRPVASSAAVSFSTSKEQLYVWGTDTSGSAFIPIERRPCVLDVPTIVEFTGSGMESLRIAKVVCGPTDTALLLSNGQCFVTGENKHGQLGVGHSSPVSQLTELVLDGTSMGIRDVSLGSHVGAYVACNGDLYAAGLGGSAVSGFGLLGQGDGMSRSTATRVESLVDDQCRVAHVATGEWHMTVVTTEGEVLTCGAGSYGRLGNCDTMDQRYLEPVEVLTPDSDIVSIAGGNSFTLALDAHGVVYGWGRNHKGQLGNGLASGSERHDRYSLQAAPEPMATSIMAQRKMVHIAAGYDHAAAVSETGELLVWGRGVHMEPVVVEGLRHTKIVAASCGRDYTLALDDDGHLYSFGDGTTGVLGVGTTGVLGQGSVYRLRQPALLKTLETN